MARALFLEEQLFGIPSYLSNFPLNIVFQSLDVVNRLSRNTRRRHQQQRRWRLADGSVVLKRELCVAYAGELSKS